MRSAVEVQSLGIRYNLRLTRKNTVRETFKNLTRIRNGPGHFWALRDVSFRLNHGESLAVIGPNGAGKSTLLQVLAKILEPTEGRIEVNGRISSLLTLGAGFDSDLSGRDNIMLAGAFMGMEHDDMVRRLPGIIEFADIGQFIDAPIKTYSTGMNARLGFSIATAVDPDVLLLDEVLGTGDATFRSKSQQRVVELMHSARAIVLVTHDMSWPVEFCNRAILLERGHIVAAGDPAEVVAIHEDRSAQRRAGVQPEPLPPIVDEGWSTAGQPLVGGVSVR
jgi:ABC-type polysaccharide/polyol phosphate transport system ATPase subunit